MNAQQLIDKLRPLEGHNIRIVDVDGNAHEQMCKSVEHLRPNERDGTQGNVILWNGEFTERGAMAGFTMTAKNALSTLWYTQMVQIAIVNMADIFIEILQ